MTLGNFYIFTLGNIWIFPHQNSPPPPPPPNIYLLQCMTHTILFLIILILQTHFLSHLYCENADLYSGGYDI